MYLSEPLNVFLLGAGGNALAGFANRYISGKDVNAETVLGDAYSGGFTAVAAYGIGNAVQRIMMSNRNPPKGYIRDSARVAERQRFRSGAWPTV